MNRWVVITLLLMAAVVVGRHIHRFGGSVDGEQTASPVVIDPLIREAHAEPLPPIDAGAQETIPDGGPLGVPPVVSDEQAAAPEPEPLEARGEEVAEAPQRQRVPLNPEPPLPEQDRVRKSPSQGPLTSLDPHQMLFEPGEKPSKQPLVRKRRVPPARRDAAPSRGPIGDVDPRQMLFEPGERAPRAAPPETPREDPAPQPPEPAATSDAAPEPVPDTIEPSADVEAKARIMKRLLRVMELAGEKP